jgi:hypothetical protein
MKIAVGDELRIGQRYAVRQQVQVDAPQDVAFENDRLFLQYRDIPSDERQGWKYPVAAPRKLYCPVPVGQFETYQPDPGFGMSFRPGDPKHLVETDGRTANSPGRQIDRSGESTLPLTIDD